MYLLRVTGKHWRPSIIDGRQLLRRNHYAFSGQM
jgi:hypothetical protein